MKTLHRLAILIFTLGLFLGLARPIFSDTQQDLDQKKQEIDQIKQELEKVQGQKQTLASTISYLNNKIRLTEAQLTSTESELASIKTQIEDLSQKITSLDNSLEDLTAQLLHRVTQSYKESRLNPFITLVASDSLNQLVSHLKYMQLVEHKNRDLIYQLETTRTDFDQQKTLKQQKEEELNALTQKYEAQKQSLAQQQLDKKNLLELTKNDEKRFQTELSKKMAELDAIQSIIAGKGDETEVGDINEGKVIASIIPGPSACSSGAHLHFEVDKNGSHQNPAGYLSGKSVGWDNGPDGPFDFTGSWPWPLSDPIRITQGYGMTFYASVIRYYGGNPHTGIDMINNDLQVKAVRKGKLYRGAIACGGGTLRYVRVQQDDGIDTYYLHINY